MGFQAGLDSLKRNRFSLYGRNCNFIPHVFNHWMDCDDEGLSKRNLYCDIQSIKNIRSVPTKKNRKTGRFWMFLSVNYCVTWKICVHCSIMLKKERCVNTLYRFWGCILVFCERNVSFEWTSCLWKRDFWVVFCKITHCQASCKTDFSVVMVNEYTMVLFLS